MSLITFLLVAYGLTQILVFGSIFDPIRPTKGKLGELFQCSMCLGFWVGVFLFGVSFYTELFTFELNLVNPFLLGWLSSGTSYILSQLFGDEGIKIKVDNNGNRH
tara:strand:- start:106 stop:420 length:315 start_codon:yes stop_codon:yes gene_type:complete